MAVPPVQNFANHTRLDPLYHMFLLPVAGINILAAIWNLFRNPSLGSAWFVVLALAGAVVVLKFRLYALKVQDRVIRLEERLRLAQLVAEPLRGRIGDLTEAQLIALRFASDSEVPALVEKALSGTMLPRDIKQAVVNWRADYFRV
jgi:4-amino-4-deoxy-L-arabinose transferase-like glycosyltransferase